MLVLFIEEDVEGEIQSVLRVSGGGRGITTKAGWNGWKRAGRFTGRRKAENKCAPREVAAPPQSEGCLCLSWQLQLERKEGSCEGCVPF
jgi:hypothetical protein